MCVQKILNNITCKEYCSTHNFKYSPIKEAHPQRVYIPNYINEISTTNSIYVNFPEIYVAELNNVKLIGDNYIIFDDNNYCIYDLPFMDSENKFDLRCHQTIAVNKNNTVVCYNETGETIEEGIMLISGSSYNYSHFQFEVLAKLCLINDTNEYNDMPIIIDDACFRVPQFQEELQMLNKQGRKIIPLAMGYSYSIKKLIVISDLGVYPCNIKPDFLLKYQDVVLDDLAVKPINKNLAIESSNVHRKLYVSRSQSPNSRLQNQPAVENIFRSFGFEIIFPGSMSFHDQLKTFSEAEVIAGESGSGLTNIIFANKNAKVIFIQPKVIHSPWYSNISGILGLKTYFLDGYLYGNSRLPYYQNGFIVDENYLKDFLYRLNLSN
ncbi:glycosyltransferase family 61 protein [Clostridium beijerinckii]|uniref:Glycosyltransferase 61 catalytic domain-containing protein n=1 Tax=Clostridium beijerinckii TaxID=1520 RepID=A0A1S8SDX3_CLOBE|nr:glycosyltransferase family 61 protein [Clostridium beijerinckii]NRY63606.1 hypothetical protein [Clostridium beijerinckii]OOM63721.1 hypothetical protein CLBCK_08560 [Clostridium beijerinckii]